MSASGKPTYAVSNIFLMSFGFDGVVNKIFFMPTMGRHRGCSYGLICLKNFIFADDFFDNHNTL
jgi:hypothetical protein